MSKRVVLTLSFLLLIVLVVGSAAFAGRVYIPQQMHLISLDSGKLGNAGPTEKIVYSEAIDIINATWIRVYFHSVELEGNSYVRITSYQDGETQIMNKKELAMWRNGTAYFNGPAVQVELIAAPGTVRNSLVIRKVNAGLADPSEKAHPVDPKFAPSKVCSETDNRVLSSDPRTARLLSDNSACSGFITNWCYPDPHSNRCMLSAGHCFDTTLVDPMNVAQFEVPPSVNCVIVMPPLNKQFPIDPTTITWQRTGIGNDWAVFACFPNSSGNTVKQEQGEGYALVEAVADTWAKKYGNGADGPKTGNPDSTYCHCVPDSQHANRNLVQQSSEGVILGVNAGGRVDHSCQTCGGDSGCPIINDNNEAVAVQTHGKCTDSSPTNVGTSVMNPDLQAALDELCKQKKIPTLSEWGLLTVVILLILAGTSVIMRRRKEFKNAA